MRRIYAIIFILMIVVACVTGDRIRSIHEGMNKNEVIAIMGNPDGFQRSGDFEALRYTNRLISGWSWDRADFNVILRSGQVVEYGAGEVRQESPNVGALVLVPLN